MLQILFGDDEHTALDGAYPRLMKARKWLYLTSALAIISAYDLYNPDALESIIKVTSIPPWLVHNLSLAGTTYLLIQYFLLLVQLLSSYDISLRTRFAFRKADDLAKAAERLSEAEDRLKKTRIELDPGKAVDLNNAIEKYKIWEQRYQQLEQSLKELKSRRNFTVHYGPGKNANPLAAGDAEIQDTAAASKRAQVEMRIATERIRQLRGSSEQALPSDGNVENEYFEAQKAYRRILKDDPATRWTYRASEVVIDIARIAPPIAVGIFALNSLRIASA